MLLFSWDNGIRFSSLEAVFSRMQWRMSWSRDTRDQRRDITASFLQEFAHRLIQLLDSIDHSLFYCISWTVFVGKPRGRSADALWSECQERLPHPPNSCCDFIMTGPVEKRLNKECRRPDKSQNMVACDLPCDWGEAGGYSSGCRWMWPEHSLMLLHHSV